MVAARATASTRAIVLLTSRCVRKTSFGRWAGATVRLGERPYADELESLEHASTRPAEPWKQL